VSGGSGGGGGNRGSGVDVLEREAAAAAIPLLQQQFPPEFSTDTVPAEGALPPGPHSPRRALRPCNSRACERTACAVALAPPARHTGTIWSQYTGTRWSLRFRWLGCTLGTTHRNRCGASKAAQSKLDGFGATADAGARPSSSVNPDCGSLHSLSNMVAQLRSPLQPEFTLRPPQWQQLKSTKITSILRN
jgi:hypothetical protein